jgi:hypothetical protein
MRKLSIVIVLVLSLFVLSGVQAKMLIQKVAISGPGIDSEFATTRADIVQGFSAGRFIDYQTEVEAPDDPGEAYILKLSYYAAGAYHVVEQVSYYPNAVDGRDVVRVGGHIYYENVSQVDDRFEMHDAVHVGGRWYYASPQGTAAFERLLAHTRTQPYLVLAGGSAFAFVDPLTLETVGSLRIPHHNEHIYVSDLRGDAAGQVITYEAYDSTAVAVYQIDLGAMSLCRTDHNVQNAIPNQQTFVSPDGGWTANLVHSDSQAAVYVAGWKGMMVRNFTIDNPGGGAANFRGQWDEIGNFYLTDGERLLAIGDGHNLHERPLDATLSASAGIVWLEIAATRNDYLYLYHPLGRYRRYDYAAHDRGEIAEGIFVVHATSARLIAHWQPQMEFAQVIFGDEYAYGLQAPRDTETVEVHALDMADGAVITSRALEPGQWSLAYIRIHPDLMPSSSVTETECAEVNRTLICMVHADAAQQCYRRQAGEASPTDWEVIIPAR